MTTVLASTVLDGPLSWYQFVPPAPSESLPLAMFDDEAPSLDVSSAGLTGSIGVVPIHGPISPRTSFFQQIFGGTALSEVNAALDELDSDPNIKAIVLDINSPGGLTEGVRDTAEMVAALSKPVIAYTGGTMASAAYWIGSQASSVVASSTAIVGNIGAVMHLPPSDGDTAIVASVSPNKLLNPDTEGGRASVQAAVDAIGNIFVDDVATGRGVSRETVLADFGQGGILVGAEAQSAGLVDHVGSMSDVLAQLGEQPTGELMSTTPTDGVAALTAESLRIQHPEIAKHFMELGADAIDRTAIAAAAVKQDRERVSQILALAAPGQEVLANTLAYESDDDVGAAAIKLMQDVKATAAATLASMEEDGEALNEGLPSRGNIETVAKSVETPQTGDEQLDRLNACWAANATLPGRNGRGPTEVQKIYPDAETFIFDAKAEESMSGRPFITMGGA